MMFSEQEKNLSEILMRSNALSPAGYEAAKVHKLQNGCSLMESLINLELAAEEALATALSKITRVPFASTSNNLLEVDYSPEIRGLIDPQFARDNVVLPMFVEGGALTVGLTDPSNDMLIEALRIKTGMDVVPMICTQTEILLNLENLYMGFG